MYSNQGYNYPTEVYYDPYTDQNYDDAYYEPQEDTEAVQLRKDQAEEDRIAAIESNRLYLKKIRKQCALEDFSNLDKKQLFLFEIVIESLEVNSESSLGLSPPGDGTQVYVIVQAQFLNSPYLEIRDKDHSSVHNSSLTEYNTYLQTVGDSWQANTKEALYSSVTTPSSPPSSIISKNPSLEPQISDGKKVDVNGTKVVCDVKWEVDTGKSCLFSMSVMEMIHNLDKYPVNVQVDRCVGQTDDGSPESREPLGYTSIRLPDDFGISVLQSLKPGVVLPVTSTHRQECDLRNVFGVKKGKVDVFIRLSAFGPVIITSLQMEGAERHYSFHPSPTVSKDEDREQQTNRSDLLKPLISEEDNAIGITNPKEFDSFQKPVLWQAGTAIQYCGCMDVPNSKHSILRSSEFDCISLTRMPLSSEISLCRNIKPPTGRKLSFGKDLCDWHNLVSLEIKNNPGYNCECLIEQNNGCWKRENNLVKKLKNGKRSYQSMPPITGLGIKPVNCDCDCPLMREVLKRQCTSPRFRNT